MSRLGEPSSNRVVDVQKVRDVVPGIGVELELLILVDTEGAILKEESNLRGASRASCEPENKGIFCWIIL